MLLRWATTSGEGLLKRRQDLPEEAFFVPSEEQLARVLPGESMAQELLHGAVVPVADSKSFRWEATRQSFVQHFVQAVSRSRWNICAQQRDCASPSILP